MAAPSIDEPDEQRWTARSEPARAALEVLLTAAAAGDGSRFVRPVAAANVGAGIACHPVSVVRRAGGMAAELVRVASGRSTIAPARRHRRFADPAWATNALIRRVLEGCPRAAATAERPTDAAAVTWRRERNARFAAQKGFGALGASSCARANPSVLKPIVDAGGANLVRGLR